MEGQFSFKSFENVRLKATYNMEVGNRHIEEGETIAIFDKIQIAGLSETVARVTANGGFDNRAHVFWETVQEQKLTFAQGIFNKTQFALLTNARVIENGNETPLMLTLRETLESDADGKITLREVPLQSIFVYDVNNGGRLEFVQDGNVLTISTPYTDVIVDYHGEQSIIELKIWRGQEYNNRGEQQLLDYLDYYHLDKGYMLCFNFNKHKTPGVYDVKLGDKLLVEAVV